MGIQVTAGKWKRLDGKIVDVFPVDHNVYRWGSVDPVETYTNDGRVISIGSHDNPRNLIAPVHEITPGSYWRLRHGKAKWFVVGKSRDGNWCLESESGGVIFSPEDAFLEPWTDPPNPRTWKVYVFATAKTSDHTRMQAYFLKEEAESSYDRISDVVEVTLTEEVKDAR